MSACSLCGAAVQTFTAREMMLGLFDTFWYAECVACGSLQLQNVPADLSRYYPASYYAMKAEPRWKRSLRVTRLAHGLGHRNLLGALLVHFFGPPDASPEWLQHLTHDSRILDVGCGRGDLVRALRRIGFRHASGLDAFIGNDVVERAAFTSVSGPYDLVMFHHSLEHMPNPREIFRHVRKILTPEGRCLVRTPIADSVAWRQYGANWVQLDAPRHLVVYTRRSLELVAEAEGLRLERVTCDSTALQFWGSELYVRNIPLTAAPAQHFTRAELRHFAVQARHLNEIGSGDQVTAWFSLAG